MLRQDRRVPRGQEDDRPRLSRPGRGGASLRARDLARRRRPCRGGHTARRHQRIPPEGRREGAARARRAWRDRGALGVEGDRDHQRARSRPGWDRAGRSRVGAIGRDRDRLPQSEGGERRGLRGVPLPGGRRRRVRYQHPHRRRRGARAARRRGALLYRRARTAPRSLRRRHRDHRHPGPRLRLPPEGPAVPRHRHLTRGRRGAAAASLGVPMTRLTPLLAAAMLVGQTAGTGNYDNDPGYLRVRDSFESVSDLVGAVNTAVPAGTVPGKTFRSSDTGYLLLGAVIEKASGRDYYEYMDDEVFAKAGVAAGFLHNTDDELKDRGFALGYEADGSKNWSGLPARGTPAADAYATAPDLLSFHKALATGALVKLETQKRLVLLPPPSGQASAGISSGVFAGNDAGASAVFAMTSGGYTVIVLANVGSVATPIADKILKLVGG